MVVYSALGQLYVKDLPSGEPRRLTKDAHYEFFPSFSRDGQWIVYTTWSDADHGRLRVIRPDGSGARDVVSTPGHYAEPSFSPDGQRSCFARSEATRRAAPCMPVETGVFVVPTDGGDPVLARGGHLARIRSHGGAHLRPREPEREVHAAERRPADRRLAAARARRDRAHPIRQRDRVRALARRAVDCLPGALPHVHRAVPAHGPAGRHRPGTQAYPVQRVSRDAGFNLHWSGDSATLYWTLGPELFSRPLGRTFTFVEGAEPKAAEPEAKGIPIGFTAGPTSRRARSRWSAHGSSRWPA
jgi:hypothetical protein